MAISNWSVTFLKYVITEFWKDVWEKAQSVILVKRWEYNQHVREQAIICSERLI